MNFILSLLLVFFVLLQPQVCLAKAGTCFVGDCENGQGTFEYETGMKYVGDWQQGKEHGRGVMTMPMGSSYEGDYQSGLPHGTGTYSLADGRKYVGEWKNGRPDGHGVEINPVGTSYDGQWHDGVPHGRGLAKKNGRVDKDGYWLAGEFVGKDKPQALY